MASAAMPGNLNNSGCGWSDGLLDKSAMLLGSTPIFSRLRWLIDFSCRGIF
jgi:hypothetical protein